MPDSIAWEPATNPIDLKRKSEANTKLAYTVREGNHIADIADIFKIPVKDLRLWNKIKGNNIKAGQRLIIFTKQLLIRKSYRIRSGDNLGSIAQILDVSIRHLILINGTTNPRRLKIGNRLFYYKQPT
ncbi:MAG: LysM peptidoglycan-binding domain-containing protein [Endozoicomonadaceae bacterium]|nr:LysM peptidoglycan-binding domain-containing protein [Endozoicomonadaceae bacterium]